MNDVRFVITKEDLAWKTEKVLKFCLMHKGVEAKELHSKAKKEGVQKQLIHLT